MKEISAYEPLIAASGMLLGAIVLLALCVRLDLGF